LRRPIGIAHAARNIDLVELPAVAWRVCRVLGEHSIHQREKVPLGALVGRPLQQDRRLNIHPHADKGLAG
jgi:hypothetical protein